MGCGMKRFQSQAPSAASRPRRTDSRGFTLVEVVMASMVLLFGIATSIVGMQIGYRSLDLARTLTLSAQVLQSEMELVRMKAWGDIATLASDPDGTAPLQKFETMFVNAAMPRDFKLTRAVADPKTIIVGTGTETVMRQITVTATWKTVDGITHTRSTSTQYCREGLNDYYVTNPSA